MKSVCSQAIVAVHTAHAAKMQCEDKEQVTLVPEVYFYYFHCEGERKNKPLVESGN